VFEYGKMREAMSFGVSIYSSKSVACIFKECEWGDSIIVSTYARSVFVNGFMHWLEFSQIIVVDMDGKTWTKIQKPCGDAISIHVGQGELCLRTTDIYSMTQLSIWILEDYDSNKWTLNHTVTTLEIFGQNNIEFGYEVCDVEYRVIAVHLEWNLIFLVGEDITLLAYDMNHKKVHVLPTRVIRYPRPTWSLCINGPYYLPYVSLFMESLVEQ
jgi:hypothetical protein